MSLQADREKVAFVLLTIIRTLNISIDLGTAMPFCEQDSKHIVCPEVLVELCPLISKTGQSWYLGKISKIQAVQYLCTHLMSPTLGYNLTYGNLDRTCCMTAHGSLWVSDRFL